MASFTGTVRNLVVCSCGLVGFAMVSVFPSHRAISALDEKAVTLQQKIAEQEVLQPAFQQLQQFANREAPSDLPYPKPAGLSQEDAGKVSNLLREVAGENDFAVVNITPDMVSFSSESEFLKVDAVLRGRFENIRPLLIRLAAMPYFAHLQKLEVRPGEGAREVRLQVWLRREKS